VAPIESHHPVLFQTKRVARRLAAYRTAEAQESKGKRSDVRGSPRGRQSGGTRAMAPCALRKKNLEASRAEAQLAAAEHAVTPPFGGRKGAKRGQGAGGAKIAE